MGKILGINRSIVWEILKKIKRRKKGIIGTGLVMGPLPITSKGIKYTLAITDTFSKWVESLSIQVNGCNDTRMKIPVHVHAHI